MFNRLKPKSKFTRNVLTLMTGTTIAQAIPIAISPILTRVYTPEDFGIFALYIAMVSFIAIVVTARYELAIVLPQTDREAINILALSLIIMSFIVVFLIIIILLFKDNLLTLLNIQNVGNFIYLMPLSILIAGLNQSFNYWSNRKEYFKNISSSQILQSIGIGLTQPTLGYFHLFGGLIVGNLIGRIIGTFVLINSFFKNDRAILVNVEKNMMVEQMKKYKDFPLINSFHAFSDILRSSGSIMLISSFFGSAVVGFYALSLRVLQVPVGIVGSALGQVLYQKFTTMYNNDENLYPYVKKIVLLLFIISLPIFAILYYIAPDLFAFVFGENWRVAGEYSQILIPYLFMNFLISPISSLPLILNKQKEIFYISLVGNIMFVSVFIIFNDIGILEILKILTLTQFIFYLYVGFWYFKIVKRDKI